jgi:hypothetical protein
MITDIWTETYIQDFTEKDIEDFQEIVLRDVKNKSFNEIEKNILNNNLDLWLFSLSTIRREIELKLSQFKTNIKIKQRDLRDNNASAEEIENFLITEQSRRNNAMKFLTHVERKTLYVKLLIQQESEKS